MSSILIKRGLCYEIAHVCFCRSVTGLSGWWESESSSQSLDLVDRLGSFARYYDYVIAEVLTEPESRVWNTHSPKQSLVRFLLGAVAVLGDFSFQQDKLMTLVVQSMMLYSTRDSVPLPFAALC